MQIKGAYDRGNFEEKIRNKKVTQKDIDKYHIYYQHGGWGNPKVLNDAYSVLKEKQKEKENQNKQLREKVEYEFRRNKHKERLEYLEKRQEEENARLEKQYILQKKDIEKIKLENPDLYAPDKSLKKEFENIESIISRCKKCNGNKMRIWDLNQTVLTLRCEGCKKKENYLQLDFDIDSKVELTRIIDLIEILRDEDRIRDSNPFYPEINFPLNFDGKKSNSPKYYEFIIHPKLNTPKTIETEKDFNKLRSRRITQEVMDKVWNRDEGKCIECGSNQNLEFDHIIPFSKGGANTYRNIQLLCESCNRSKSNKIG